MGPEPGRSRQVRVREGMLWVRMTALPPPELGAWGRRTVLDGPRKKPWGSRPLLLKGDYFEKVVRRPEERRKGSQGMAWVKVPGVGGGGIRFSVWKESLGVSGWLPLGEGTAGGGELW